MKALKLSLVICCLLLTVFACKVPITDAVNPTDANTPTAEQLAHDKANIIAISKTVLDAIQNPAVIAEVKNVVDKKLDLADDEFVSLLNYFPDQQESKPFATPLLYQALEQNLGNAKEYAQTHPMEAYWAYSKYWNGSDPIAVAYVTDIAQLNKKGVVLEAFVKKGGILETLAIDEAYMQKNSVVIIKDLELTFVAENNLQQELSNTKNIATQATNAGAGANLDMEYIDLNKLNWGVNDEYNSYGTTSITYRRVLTIKAAKNSALSGATQTQATITKYYSTSTGASSGVIYVDPVNDIVYPWGKGTIKRLLSGIYYNESVWISPEVTDAYHVSYACRVEGWSRFGPGYQKTNEEVMAVLRSINSYNRKDFIKTGRFDYYGLITMDDYISYVLDGGRIHFRTDSRYMINHFNRFIQIILNRTDVNMIRRFHMIWQTDSPKMIMTTGNNVIQIPYFSIMKAFTDKTFVRNGTDTGYAMRVTGAVELK